MPHMAKDAKGRRPRRSFTEGFRGGAALLVLDEGKTVGQVSRDLEPTETALREWVHRSRAHTAAASPLAWPIGRFPL